MTKLPDELQAKWDEADRTGRPVDVGSYVVCACGRDYTSSSESGGVIFGGEAYGRCCAPRLLRDVERYGEQDAIRATCADGQSFADMVRAYRDRTGATTITVRKR